MNFHPHWQLKRLLAALWLLLTLTVHALAH